MRAIDTLGRAHLEAPAAGRVASLCRPAAWRPRRAHRAPNSRCRASVAVEIDPIAVEIGGNELGQAHGARPGAAHVGGLGVALLQHFQRQQEFLRGTSPCGGRDRPASPARVSRCAAAGSRRNSVSRPQIARRTVGGTPKRCSIARQRRAVLGGELAALRGQPRERGLRQILGGRADEFGLALSRRLRPAGHDQIGQGQIRLEIARGGVEGLARDAELLRGRPKRRRATGESGVGRATGVPRQTRTRSRQRS